MGRFLESLADLVETWTEFKSWRDDWNRTWSPASYFLAFAMLVAVAILIYFYGRELLDLATGAGRAGG